MKILLVTEWFLPHSGGMEIILYNVIRHSREDTYIVFSPAMPGCQDFDKKQDFGIIRSQIWARRGIGGTNIGVRLYTLSRLILKSLKLISAHKVDIVFFSSLHLYMGIWALALKSFTKKPCFAFVFAEGIDRTLSDRRIGVKILAQFGMLALRKMDGLIAGSNYTVNKLLGWKVPAERIIKNLPCVDLEKFKPGLEYEDILRRHGIENKKIILTVSRLEKSKGIDLVIKALPGILKQLPDAVYLIVGSGREQGNLHLLTKNLNISDKVIFVGDVSGYAVDSDLPRYYNACDVFIMASHVVKSWNETEGFGIVFLEASACGKPVIGGRSGGTPDAIIDGVTGVLIDPEDKEQIVNSIINLLTNRPLAESLGRNGRLRAEREFSWDKYVSDIRNAALKIRSNIDR